MRFQFDQQLAELKKEMVLMGGLCENAIALAVKSLVEGEGNLTGEVPALAGRIERRERDIEALCLKLLLRQHPVARDLRTISSALKMVTDMERIGHQSADIAEIVSAGTIGTGEDLSAVHAMARAAISMVTDSIDAFVKEDAELARLVIARDDEVDRWFDTIKESLIRRLGEGAAVGSAAVDLLMVVKYLERIGDHAVNIAQWVLYSMTGELECEST